MTEIKLPQLPLPYYNPQDFEVENKNQRLLYTFQYENAISQFVTDTGGNCSGGQIMDTDLDTGMTAPFDNEINQQYVIFVEDEVKRPYGEIDILQFFYPDGTMIGMDLEQAAECLVGIQIIQVFPEKI